MPAARAAGKVLFFYHDRPVLPGTKTELRGGCTKDCDVRDLERRGHVKRHAVIADNEPCILDDIHRFRNICLSCQIDDFSSPGYLRAHFRIRPPPQAGPRQGLV